MFGSGGGLMKYFGGWFGGSFVFGRLGGDFLWMVVI